MFRRLGSQGIFKEYSIKGYLVETFSMEIANGTRTTAADRAGMTVFP
jgi:hypothetical protein